jgi:hypothetical protein
MIRLWLWPFMLAVLTLTGLISGLVSESVGDMWAWVGLGIPILVCVYCGAIRKP